MWDLLLFKYRARLHRDIRFMYGRVQPRRPIQIVFWPENHAFWADGPLGSNPRPINGNWRGSRDKCREQGLSLPISECDGPRITSDKRISQHLSGREHRGPSAKAQFPITQLIGRVKVN